MAISKDTEASSSISNTSPNAPGRGGSSIDRGFTQGGTRGDVFGSEGQMKFYVKDYAHLANEEEFLIVTEASQKIIIRGEGGRGEKGGGNISE